ncbi:MAG: acyl-CoA dehydratase activase-related protein [Bacillota bacterium]|nr:acyl-CoA dehydratase activase-related protein [Bacillota bacterium]
MNCKIGIPRALYYFHFFPLWETFLAELGFEPVVSPPTNQDILQRGLSTCVESACLPLKAFVGHATFLVEQGLDLLFVPQVISVIRKEYTCPYLLGLPDLVRSYLPATVRLFSPVLDARRGKGQPTFSYLRFGLQFKPPLQAFKAWRRAKAVQDELEKAQQNTNSLPGGLNILLLGPRYLTDDAYLNGNLLRKLEELGTGVITAAAYPDAITWPAARFLAKPPYWTSTRRAVGALEQAINRIDGVLSIAPFGCGAHAMQGVLVGSRISGSKAAHLQIYLDEHTSPVGLVTRLEAFCDLLERKMSG